MTDHPIARQSWTPQQRQKWKQKRANQLLKELPPEERDLRLRRRLLKHRAKALAAQRGEKRGEINWNKINHKIKTESRATHLALGFLRGVPYASMEQKAYSQPDWKLVELLADDFLIGHNQQSFTDWMNEAKNHSQAPDHGIKITITVRGNQLLALRRAAAENGWPLTQEIRSAIDWIQRRSRS